MVGPSPRQLLREAPPQFGHLQQKRTPRGQTGRPPHEPRDHLGGELLAELPPICPPWLTKFKRNRREDPVPPTPPIATAAGAGRGWPRGQAGRNRAGGGGGGWGDEDSEEASRMLERSEETECTDDRSASYCSSSSPSKERSRTTLTATKITAKLVEQPRPQEEEEGSDEQFNGKRGRTSTQDLQSPRRRITSSAIRVGSWKANPTYSAETVSHWPVALHVPSSADVSLVKQALRGLAFDRLLVLTLAGIVGLGLGEMEVIVGRGLQLRKLDLSYCGLHSQTLPQRSSWAQMHRLRVLFMHRNCLGNWADLQAVTAPPGLVWLTFFENPIAGQPEVRQSAIAWGRKLEAVDLWVVTDGERLEFRPRRKGLHPSLALSTSIRQRNRLGLRLAVDPCRFDPLSDVSVILFRVKPATDDVRSGDPRACLAEYLTELLALYWKSYYCCAASVLQKAWRGRQRWLKDGRLRALRAGAKGIIHSRVELWIWRHRQLQDLKIFLAKAGTPELLLDTKEMLRLRATLRIETSFKRIITERRELRKTRDAATLVCRCIRGYLARVKVLHQYLEPNRYRRVFFPAKFIWEFLVLLNVARRECHYPTLPRNYEFANAGIMALRTPEVSALPARCSSLTRLICMRNNFPVRPCRTGRFPTHLWDGPVHRLTDGRTTKRVEEACAKLKPRLTNVDNTSLNAFLRSCALGPHPVEGGSLGRSYSDLLADGEEEEQDFRDIWQLGTKLGEGTFGMAFTCLKKGDIFERPHVVRVNQHHTSWWGAFRATQEAQWRMLEHELSVLANMKHPNIVDILDVYVDKWFAYFVMERYAGNIAMVSAVNKKFGQRGLPTYVIGEMVGQALGAVEYLHSNNVVHRDIRAESCVVDTLQVIGQPFRVLLGDLNCAHRVEKGIFVKVPLGAPEYWAPEVIARRYSLEADLWAVGVVLWSLLAMQVPFADLEAAVHMPLARHHGISEEQFELSSQLLQKSPESRISARDALENPWLQGCRARHRQDLAHLSDKTSLNATTNSASGGPGAPLNSSIGPSSKADAGGVGAMTGKRPGREGNDDRSRRIITGPVESQKMVMQGVLAKLRDDEGSHHRNPRNPDHWKSLEMWLTENGSFLYWCAREECPVVNFTIRELRMATVTRSDRKDWARTFIFEIKIPVAGREPILARYSAETASLRDQWIAKLETFSSSGRQRQEALRQVEQRVRVGEKMSLPLGVALNFEKRLRHLRDEGVLGEPALPRSAVPDGLAGATTKPLSIVPPEVKVDTYEWWDEAICHERGWLAEEDKFKRSGSDVEVVCHLWPEKPSDLSEMIRHHCTHERAEDIIRTWDLAKLHDEIATRKCSLQVQNGVLTRVVDEIALKLTSPGGYVLVGTCSGGDDDHFLPSVPVVAYGSGRQELEPFVSSIVEHEIGAPPEVLQVNWIGGAQPDYVMKDIKPSAEFPGLQVLSRTHILAAETTPAVTSSRSGQIGLPGRIPFESPPRSRVPVIWEWREESWCFEHNIVPRPRKYCFPEGEDGPRWCPCPPLTFDRPMLLDMLARNGVTPHFFGVGCSLTLSQFLIEINRGEVQLFESPSDARQKELLRKLNVLHFHIRDSFNNYLVQTALSFPDSAATEKSSNFPMAELRPYEDEDGCTRRMLRELGIPFTTATVRYSTPKSKRVFDPTYPGVVTLSEHQIVYVDLHDEIPVTSRDGNIAHAWSSTPAPAIEGPSNGFIRSIESSNYNLELQELLESPESEWPPEAQIPGSPLQLFLREARIVGARAELASRRGSGVASLSVGVHSTESRRSSSGVTRGRLGSCLAGVRNYRDAVWSSEPMLSYTCQSVLEADHLVSVLFNFRGFGGLAPLVQPIPFLIEKSVLEVSAAVCIQATYRSYRSRRALACGVRTAVALRRAALCIQQAHRWGGLSRRLSFLQGAAQAVREIKCSTLYIEERLFLGLNLINGVDRMASHMPEKGLGFAWKDDHLVVVARNFADSRKEGPKKRSVRLPAWLGAQAGGLETVNLSEAGNLTPVVGLQGLLTMGIGDPHERHDRDLVTVTVAATQHAAMVEPCSRYHPKALAASGGRLRFLELKFRSLADAQHRMLLVYMCTFSARQGLAVPLTHKTTLHSPTLAQQIFHLWDSYGLTWSPSDRATTYRLRQRYLQTYMDVVPLAGRDNWSSVQGRDWLHDATEKASSPLLGRPASGSPASAVGRGPSFGSPVSCTSPLPPLVGGEGGGGGGGGGPGRPQSSQSSMTNNTRAKTARARAHSASPNLYLDMRPFGGGKISDAHHLHRTR